MEALSDQSSFSRQSRDQGGERYAGGNAVLWIAVIAVLIGLNFASWSFCMWVFGQPEHPMNYRLLTRLQRLEPIRGFTPVTAPRGKFRSAKDLYAQVYPFSPNELRVYNGILKRHYIKNYLERDDVTFLSGEFTLVSLRAMREGDVFPAGYALRARSTTFPDAYVDLALPAESTPETFSIPLGETIKIEESSTCAAVLHIERMEDSTMIITVVPLVEGRFEFGEDAAIEVKIPPQIRIEPECWPITREEDIMPMPVRLGPEGGGESPEGEPRATSDPPEAAPALKP